MNGRRQHFKTEALKDELERCLGFRLRALERMGGASALNFKAVRASDGLTFVVKCSPEGRHDLFDLQAEHLAELKGTRAVQRIFEDRCPRLFAGCRIMCLKWCAGEPRLPDELTESQYELFLADFREFSESLQRIGKVGSPRPVLQWKYDALAKCRGLGGRILRRILLAIDDRNLTYCEGRLKNIHSDFHPGNFLFEHGRISGFMDFEGTRLGYPAEDLVRYVTCAATHVPWYSFGRRSRIRGRFREAVRRLDYPPQDWSLGICARFVILVHRKTCRQSGIGLFRAVELWLQWRFFGQLLSDLTRLDLV